MPLMTISEWADKYRILAGEGTPFPGKWRTSRTPYLRAIMDALSPHSGIAKVVFMKGTQLGATEVANNVAFFYIDVDPSPIGFYFSKDEKAALHSKGKLTPSIRATPELREKVRDGRNKETGSTVLSKYFNGGFLLLRGANAADNFAGDSLRIVIKDEFSRWPPDVGGEGDPGKLADNRADAYTYTKKIYELSSPTEAGFCKVETSFKNSNQQYYYVPCPHCGRKQRITWAGIKFKKSKDDVRDGDVFLLCENEKCAKLIPESSKEKMLLAGEWRAHNPGNPVHGFHLSSLYSPWLKWATIVDEFLEAHRERDAYKLRVWTNTRLAETFGDGGAVIDENEILNRLEEFPAQVPAGVCRLTFSADIQGDRFEYAVIGWGVGHQAWVIEHGRVPGDLATKEFWENMEDQIKRKYRHALGFDMGISIAGIDSGHGKTEVYNFVRTRQKKNVFALKGANVADYPLIKRPKKPSEGIMLYMVGTNTGKDWVHNCLKLYNIKDENGEPVHTDGPNFIHFQKNISTEFIEQLTSEVKRFKKGKLVWDKKNPGITNEGLDLMVYGRALIAMLNPAFEVILKNLKIKSEAIKAGKPVPSAGHVGRKIYSRGIER